ncbi:MAG: efflux RND transporter periplasmic adaptor subunit [Thermoguttaceae bacterium]
MMNTQSSPHRSSKRWRWLAAIAILVALGLAAAGLWSPQLRRIATSSWTALAAHSPNDGHDHAEKKKHDDEDDDHHDGDRDHHDGDEDEHDHAHAAQNHKHDEATSIKLSKQAQNNIGLRLTKVALGPFERTMNVPGIVVERPGWSVLEVTAPMTGVVMQIYPIQGEAVRHDQPLFEIRLTHEDLLQLQTEFLRTVEELDVIGHEVARLEKISADGVIAGKTLLERKYEQQKQEAAMRAQRQALLLHGLSEEQVNRIASTRTLLQSLTIYAPEQKGPNSSRHPPRHLQVQQLKVTQGKHVNAGDTLCTLVDQHELFIEGIAFEQDIQSVNRVAASTRKVSATFGSKSSGDEHTTPDLRILYLDDKVDPQSRAFHFYVTLPNRILREDKTPEGRNFVYWQFKPGQRTQLRIPVEAWTNRIVLPVEAIAQDGAEFYVFEANGDHFDRRAVHVEYRDQDWAVIANDGALRVGSTVAASAAHQVHLALKNKSGGGVDPHAGHNH